MFGPVLESRFSIKIHFFYKNGSQMGLKLDLKSNLCAERTPYFHPWVDKGAQVVPKGAQMVARVTKSYTNGIKMLPKVFKI